MNRAWSTQHQLETRHTGTARSRGGIAIPAAGSSRLTRLTVCWGGPVSTERLVRLDASGQWHEPSPPSVTPPSPTDSNRH
jgi:hypothetical protein